MDRKVKERLVGAAVLVALAVILIPELLSGPTPKEPDKPSARTEQGIKTYQFELNERGSTNGQFTGSTAAPPAEQPPPETAEAPAAQAPVETNAPAEEPVEAPTRSPPTAVPATPPSPPAATPATNPANVRGWAVQLGSFADEARARSLVQRLQSEGHTAYLVPLRRGDGKTLQRVRVGPYEQRAAADDALRQVGGQVKGATVVAQP